jgi:glycerophosphoryl diester phosphodiesterase
MHLYDSMPKPVVFGHRGASRYAPENTIAAFDLAISQGAKAFELDTMLTSDGVPVVIHDHTLERTTNGYGKVDQKTIDEIRELDAGSHFSEEFTSEKIPMLEEVLKRYPEKILINIELKNYHSPKNELARIVLDMVESHGMLEQVIFSSFLPRNLRILRSIQPHAKTALLLPRGILGFLFSTLFFKYHSPEIIHPSFKNITKGTLKKEHFFGRHVNVWTVNELNIAKKLIDWGVDGLITDDPGAILQLLQ